MENMLTTARWARSQSFGISTKPGEEQPSSPCPEQPCGCVTHKSSSRAAGRDKQRGQTSPRGGCLMPPAYPAARMPMRICHHELDKLARDYQDVLRIWLQLADKMRLLPISSVAHYLKSQGLQLDTMTPQAGKLAPRKVSCWSWSYMCWSRAYQKPFRSLSLLYFTSGSTPLLVLECGRELSSTQKQLMRAQQQPCVSIYKESPCNSVQRRTSRNLCARMPETQNRIAVFSARQALQRSCSAVLGDIKIPTSADLREAQH